MAYFGARLKVMAKPGCRDLVRSGLAVATHIGLREMHTTNLQSTNQRHMSSAVNHENGLQPVRAHIQ